jgi:DNA polymerase-3 subunit gamma/tau
MGRALYRKYRPTTFSQAVGQEHITKTLRKAIDSDRISHAYLFTGPRGVGKTSVARILAHEVNGITYDDDSTHLDIIEIDAASNRRIDEIRDLRDKVHTAPTSAKYKIYIIDEVHMLTREAFNALLKTLEEPPAHVIFILATTEVHKLPETIISRTQRFSFKPADTKTLTDYLGKVAKKEKIKVTPEALNLLAEHGRGSFRDSMSLLDQLSASGEEITESSVRHMLGLPGRAEINEIISAIGSGDSAKLLVGLDSLKTQGSNTAAIAAGLGEQLREKLIMGGSGEWIPVLMRQLLEVGTSSNPMDSLEISLLDAAAKNKPAGTARSAIVADGAHTSSIKHQADKEIMKEKPLKIMPQTTTAKKEIVLKGEFDLNKHWPEVAQYAKRHAASLYTALRLAKPVLADETLILYFKFPLHQKKLNQSHQKDLIGQIIEEVAGAKVKVECEVNKEIFNSLDIEIKENLPDTPSTEGNKGHNATKSISNIFGSAEVLESS